MRNLFFLLPLAASLAACHHVEPDVEPTRPTVKVDKMAANYDVLANDNGHWHWVKHFYPYGQWKDSAIIGYGRQLLFRSDSTIVLRRTAQPNYVIPYTFAIGNAILRCQSRLKYIAFATGETQLPRNYGYRFIRPLPNAQGLPEKMMLIQDGECLDGGATEVYRWIHEN
jgi:hypothetical protein